MMAGSDALVPTEDETQLAQAVGAYARDRLSLSDVRAARDVPAGRRFNAERWQEVLSLGWPTLNLPVRFGGAGAGVAVLGVVAQELGRSLAEFPLASTAMAATCLVEASGTKVARVLDDLVAGRAGVTMAAQEGRQHDPFAVETTAALNGDRWIVNGTKTAVLDADIAAHLVVVARTGGSSPSSDGLTLLLVDSGAGGTSRVDTLGVDSRWTSTIMFSDVEVGHDSVVGAQGGGGELLERAYDVGTLVTAAEMVGGMSTAFETTVAFLKERHQFGVAIGSFQALQHRIARAWVRCELARSAVMAGLRAFDADPVAARGAVSAAKAMVNDAYRMVTAEGLQMHGGFGMTDEADIGLFLKRARVAEQLFGTSAFHRSRFATSLGF